jgi:hypothetical protein
MTFLNSVATTVLETVTHDCPEPLSDAFVDPRPTLWEGWLFAACQATQLSTTNGCNASFLVDTCVLCVSLLLKSNLGKTQADRLHNPGMSLDGPHSLRMTEFLVLFFGTGHDLLQQAAHKLTHWISYEPSSMPLACIHARVEGIVLIMAALLRAIEGALPPWNIEYAPELFSALYTAMGKSPELFRHLLQGAMQVHRSSTVTTAAAAQHPSNGNASRELLSGRSFYGTSERAQLQFLQQAMEQVQKDDSASWRRFKVLVKQACGGKKKETDFGQKPAFTKWEFDRI